MNTNLLKVVKEIISQYGEEVLEDPRRLKAFFGDLAKDEPKPLRLAFGRCVEEGAYNALKSAADAAERAERKVSITQRVLDEHGLAPTLSAEALDILEAALFEGVKQPLLCKNCGKTLQEDWKACPYCLMPCGSIEPALATPTAVPPPVPQYAPPSQPPPPAPQSVPLSVVAPVQPALGVAGANFVQIPAGTFMMGSPEHEAERSDDEVMHQVMVSSFCMGKFAVTQGEWREVMGYNPSKFLGDNLPVENVSWHNAIEYCNKLSQREGLTPAYTIEVTKRFLSTVTEVTWEHSANGYRLPTEAEWEYACRAGTASPFNTGSTITTGQANFDGEKPYTNNTRGMCRRSTVEVGSFAPNGWGLYNMHGNVSEWCWDWYRHSFLSGVQLDTGGPSSGTGRVMRGGAWFNGARYIRSAFRGSFFPDFRGSDVGFRLVHS